MDFYCDGDAFQQPDEPAEVARILRRIATKVENLSEPAGTADGPVIDQFGNNCGRWTLHVDGESRVGGVAVTW